jgi:hypothetical protein
MLGGTGCCRVDLMFVHKGCWQRQA